MASVGSACSCQPGCDGVSSEECGWGWWSESVPPPTLGCCCLLPSHWGFSSGALWSLQQETFLSRRASLCLVLCPLKPPAHTGGGTAPFLCVRYSPAMCPHCALPSLSLSPPHSCSTQLLSLHHAQLLSCQTLRLARWAAAAQTLWGFLLEPAQPLSLLLCHRMGPLMNRESGRSSRTPAPLGVPVPGSRGRMGGCYKHNLSRINVWPTSGLALVVMSSGKEKQDIARPGLLELRV